MQRLPCAGRVLYHWATSASSRPFSCTLLLSPLCFCWTKKLSCMHVQQTLSGVSNKTKHPNITSHTFSGTCESFLHLGSSFSSGEHFPRYDLISSRSSSSWMALWLLFKLDRHRNSPDVSVFPAVVGRCEGEEQPCSWLAESVPSTRCRNLKPSTQNTPLTLTLWK